MWTKQTINGQEIITKTESINLTKAEAQTKISNITDDIARINSDIEKKNVAHAAQTQRLLQLVTDLTAERAQIQDAVNLQD